MNLGEEKAITEADDRHAEGQAKPRPKGVLHSRPWRLIRLPLLLLVLLGALAALGMYGLAAWLERQPEKVAGWLEEAIGQPLSIEQLDARWTGTNMLLQLDGIALLDPDRSKKLMRFKRLSVDLAVWDSIREQAPRIGTLQIEGAVLAVRRYADRRVEISGLEHLMASGGNAQSNPQWLQRLPDLELRDCELVWFDEKRRAGLPPLHFREADITLHNEPGRHRMQGRVVLPEGFGDALEVSADIEGDLFTGQWSGRGRFATSGLDLPAWFRDRRFLGLQYQSGQVGIEADIEWKKAAAVYVKGGFALHELQVAPRSVLAAEKPAEKDHKQASTHAGLSKLTSQFEWRDDGQQWKLELPEVRVQGSEGEWTSHLAIRADSAPDATLNMQIETGQIRAKDLIPLAEANDWLPVEAYEALVGLQPKADLGGVQIQLRGDEGTDFLIQMQINRLETKPWQDIPGIKGLAGQLKATANDGVLSLQGRDMQLDFNGLLPEPLRLDELGGELMWRKAAEHWQIDSRAPLNLVNPDIRLQGRLSGQISNTGEADLDVRLRLQDAVAVAVRKYVPAAIMDKEPADWLNMAFKGGTITKGGVLLLGNPNDFPFDQGQGRFEARLDAQDGHLFYWHEWPELTGIRAHAAFINQGMRVTADQGKIYRGGLEHVEVTIPDLNHSILTVKGRAIAPAEDMQRFVYESPLNEQIGDGLRRLELQGDTALNLEISLPFDTMDTEVHGVLEFDGGSVTVLEPRFEFTQVTGQAEFDRNALRAKAIKARFRDRDVVVKLDRGELPGKRAALQVDVAGRMDVRRAIGAEVAIVEQLVTGEPLWNVNVLVETDAPANRENETRVRVLSDLRGAEIRLPKPLNKTSKTQLPFRLDIKVDGDKLGPLNVQLGKDVQGVLELIPDAKGDGMLLNRGEIVYGLGKPNLPKAPGMVLRGKMKETAMAPWLAVIENAPGGTGDGPGIVLVKAEADRLFAYGRIAHDVRMEAKPVGDLWQLDVVGKQIEGRIMVPKDPSVERPLDIELKRLHLGGGEKTGGRSYSATDPRALPPMLMRVEAFQFGDKHLGQLDLDLVPTDEGLRVRSLDLMSPDSSMRAWGDWFFDGLQHRSVFEIDLLSDDLNASLKRWLIDAEVESEQMNAHLSANWDAAPMDFDWEILQGTMNMNVAPGSLLEVDPGMARLLGLLSIPGLTRRVKGDFSDLTEEGLVFDKIEGDFRFSDGKAYTDNMVTDGPVAKIKITGDIGLAKEDYELVLHVTPKLSSSLPVASVLLGGTGVGAVVLVAQQVFGDEFDSIAKQRYTVTGPWKDPLVDGLTAAQRAAQDAIQAEANELDDQDILH